MAPPPLAAREPSGREQGRILALVGVGLAGMLLGGLIGAGATAAVDNWRDHHVGRLHAPVLYDERPAR